MKSNIMIILLSFCMVFFSCCCNDDCIFGRITVTYKVESTSISNASVMFNNDYGDPELYRSVSLPWEYTFTIKNRGKDYYGGDYNGYFPAFVSARSATSVSGLITVMIYVNGKPVESASTTSTRPTAEARYNVEF